MTVNGWVAVAEEAARNVLRKAGVTPVIRAGTVVSRSAIGNEVSVVFDGDAGQVMKVKCATNIEVYADDRVTLAAVKGLTSSEWIVVGTFGRADVARSLLRFQFTGTGTFTTSSATFVDMPDTPTLQVVKRYQDTYLDVDMRVTSYVSAAASIAAAYGVNIDSIDYEVVMPHVHNVASTHIMSSGIMHVAAGIPAGTYTLTARWRKSAGGAGDVTADANDHLYVKVAERR